MLIFGFARPSPAHVSDSTFYSGNKNTLLLFHQINSIPDKGCFGCEDYTETEEDRNACIDIFKLVDSIESRDASERDANEKDELSDDSSSNSRKVKFHKDVVTSVRRSPRWTPEEKSFLFYTGREMYSFRMEYILPHKRGIF